MAAAREVTCLACRRTTPGTVLLDAPGRVSMKRPPGVRARTVPFTTSLSAQANMLTRKRSAGIATRPRSLCGASLPQSMTGHFAPAQPSDLSNGPTAGWHHSNASLRRSVPIARRSCTQSRSLEANECVGSRLRTSRASTEPCGSAVAQPPRERNTCASLALAFKRPCPTDMQTRIQCANSRRRKGLARSGRRRRTSRTTSFLDYSRTCGVSPPEPFAL